MVKLQEDALAKEEARALAMRKRYEQYTARFLNAKQRTIGINKEYLDLQVEDKKQRLIREKEKGLQEAEFQAQVFNYLEEKENLANEMQKKQIQDMKETLLEQMKMPKNNALKSCPPDLNICGPSAVQTFEGEDPEFVDRKKMQQKLVKEWCNEQVEEKTQKEKRDKQAIDDYAQHVLAEDSVRCETAKEQEEAHRSCELYIQSENERLAEERRLRKHSEGEESQKLKEMETLYVQKSPFYCEDSDYGKSMLAEHRVRPDHFKGFDKDKIKSLYDENEILLAEKEARQKNEQEMEATWAEQQAQMLEQMEAHEREKQKIDSEEIKRHLDTLDAQKKMSDQKRETAEKDRFGSIGDGFFQKFGTLL